MAIFQQTRDGRAAGSAAVASFLLFVSCVDGFLKNTHGNVVFYVLKDVALLALAFAAAAYVAAHPLERPRGKWNGIWPLGIFVAFMTVQILNPAGGDVFTGIAGFRAEVLFVALFFIGAIFFTSTKRVFSTVNVAIACLMIPAIAGIIQAVAPDTWNSLSPSLTALSARFTSYQSAGLGGLTTAFMRSYGTLVDPASLGLAMCTGFILASGSLARARGASRVVLIVCMIFMATALQLSGSRASAAGLAAGLLAFVVLSWGVRAMRVPSIIAVCILLMAIPIALQASGGLSSARYQSDSIDYGAMTRARSEAIVLKTSLTQPFGLGLGATGAGGRINKGGHGANSPLFVDNLYYATLYQVGFAGLAIFLLLQGSFLFLAIRASRRAATPEARAAYITLACLQIALLTSGIWMQGSFVYAPAAQIFWLLSGIIAMPKRVEGSAR